MKILTQLRFYVVIATLSFTGLLINYLNKIDELNKVKDELIKCQTENSFIPGGDISKANSVEDSLRNELFIEKVNSGRHEITREEIFYKYPKVKKEYDSFYQHQTE
jgi:hypothetical protein